MVKNKKFLFLLFVFQSFFYVANAQDFAYSRYYDGYWGNWEIANGYALYGNYASMIFKFSSDHPSEFLFRFTINSYVSPSAAEIKSHLRTNQPFVYSGTAEYYVTDDCPTAKDALKMAFPFVSRKYAGTKAVVKKTAYAEIRIIPYKKRPRIYNVFFDGVGFAIDMGNLYFR